MTPTQAIPPDAPVNWAGVSDQQITQVRIEQTSQQTAGVSDHLVHNAETGVTAGGER